MPHGMHLRTVLTLVIVSIESSVIAYNISLSQTTVRITGTGRIVVLVVFVIG